MRSRMNTASWIALSTKYPFAIFGLFGSMSRCNSCIRDDVQVGKAGKGKPGWKTKQGFLFFHYIQPMQSNIAEMLGRNPLPDLHGTNNRIALRRGLLA